MLVVVSDTHSREESKLQGRTAEAVREADVVVHAGDFYREPVLNAFESATRSLRAVYGNNDDAGSATASPRYGRWSTPAFGSRSPTGTATATPDS